MEGTILQYIDAVGIGGAALVTLFFICKYLMNQIRSDRQYMEERLTGIIKDYNESSEQHTVAMVEHTKALTELTIYLKAKNGDK